MGGYAVFVWPAYALTAAVMFALAVDSFRQLRAQRRALRRLEAAAPPRRRRDTASKSGGGHP
jgi:heme exporter protein D